MTLSFAQLWEQIEKEKASRSPLMTSGEDDMVFSVVRAGTDMHKEGQTPFWDEFISLCNNSEGLAQLLGVSREMVSTWPSKVHEALEKMERHAAMSHDEDEKDELMPTGDNGAITFGNSDPANIGDVQ